MRNDKTKLEIHKNALEKARARRMADAATRAANYMEHTSPPSKSLTIHLSGITVLSFLCLSRLIENASTLSFVLLSVFDIVVLPIILIFINMFYQVAIRIYKAEKKSASTHKDRKKKYFKKLKKMQSLKR